ncbi:MAG: potassium channel family protein [Desulfomonilia bacterium]|jgi:hypothetical protein
MMILSAVLGAGLIAIILGDAFETILLPRRVIRRIRLARLFFRFTWLPWSRLSRSIVSDRYRETYLSYYGPLSLLLLLIIWAGGLIFGFALMYSAQISAFHAAEGYPGFGMALYLSGTTFFTLGLGDVIPHTAFARFLTVMEAGMGFAFLALIIGYLPALNQSFTQREITISLLDARAGSPPTAAEIFLRHSHDKGLDTLFQLLHDWERWSAELLEIHLSYPTLAFFRSQHDNQSWLGALTAILDTCALTIVGVEDACARQAELTFAMARHAVVDLSIVLSTPPQEPEYDRLPEHVLAHLRSTLAAAGLQLREGKDTDQKLRDLRRMYEPYAYSLAKYLCITIPPWVFDVKHMDNWQTSEWRLIPDSHKSDRSDKPGKRHF